MTKADRIRTVQDYIQESYGENLALPVLAEMACMSEFHFSRVFRSVTGTSPMKYLKEVRLDKSVHFLLNSDRPIGEIALQCGFESLSGFNASFRSKYGSTPRQIRKSRPGNYQQKTGREKEESPTLSSHTLNKSFLRRIWNMNMEIKDFPRYRIAYFRHVGSYLEAGKNWNRLMNWVSKNNLWREDMQFIGISRDDPATTEEDACRHDACFTLPEDFREIEGGGVEYGTIPPGKYGVYDFYDKPDKMAIVFRTLFGDWLPESGYEADSRPCLEINLNNPVDDPEGKSKCLICIPLREKKEQQ
ncbi:MAG: AraC family transcriptional regulator [Spirochaetales bacterium]|nr:AraC family transcriptional regulator [Spirochaetales bacterium]